MLSVLTKLQVRLQNPERGATAIEYGLMVSLIAVVMIAAVSFFGRSVNTLFDSTAISV